MCALFAITQHFRDCRVTKKYPRGGSPEQTLTCTLHNAYICISTFHQREIREKSLTLLNCKLHSIKLWLNARHYSAFRCLPLPLDSLAPPFRMSFFFLSRLRALSVVAIRTLQQIHVTVFFLHRLFIRAQLDMNNGIL